MTIDGFRESLGITDDQYRLFADLKKRVILPAIKEINTKTNIVIRFELTRRGKKFSHITFYFDEKAQHQLDLTEPESKEAPGLRDFLLDVPKFGSH